MRRPCFPPAAGPDVCVEKLALLSESQAKRLCDRVIDMAGKRQVEVLVEASEHALTRFADNAIHQNVAQSDAGLSIRMLIGKRVGRASTNRTDDRAIADALARCEALARVQTPDPEMPPLLGPQRYEKLRAYVAATASWSPRDRMERVREAAALCQSRSLRGAGVCSNSVDAFALANSKGLFAYHRMTASKFSITAMADGSSGWAEQTDKDARRLDARALAERAVQKALASADPTELPPGEYTVVFEHAAVVDFLMFLAFDAFGAQAFLEGSSFLSGRLGEKVFGDNITIRDDAYHPDTTGMPFDFEGVPRRAVTLVERGVAKAVVHDRRTAKKAGARSTGHGFPQPNAYGPLPLNLVMEGGDSSVEEMVASIDKGLLVTRLHYTNVIDPKRLIITGMTRDGTFLIENGKLSRGVKNLRFTESIPKLLNHVTALSRDRISASTFFGGCGFVAPAIQAERFTFTSGTEF